MPRPPNDGTPTKGELDLLRELVDWYADNPYPPSIRELGERLGCSYQWAHARVLSLEEKGYVQYDARIHRGLYVTEKVEELGL